MEGKPHTSHSYAIAGQVSRMAKDLDSCSRDFKSSSQRRTPVRQRASAPRNREGLRVCVIGAGLSGLRCAEVLLANGVDVTILEARDRLGGRVHQEALGGWRVDMGPNWVHGTHTNPLVQLAKKTQTSLRAIEGHTRIYLPSGVPIDDDKAEEYFDVIWEVIAEAFKYSNECCESIEPDVSLRDFFEEKLPERDLSEEDRQLIMHIAEMWGSFTGDPLERQSLKWFWLEECLDGENLFVPETHKAIIGSIAESAIKFADIHFDTKVMKIEDFERGSGDLGVCVSVRRHDGDHRLEFDEVVVTAPLGCLKRGDIEFSPGLPFGISQAIRDASYSRLEKVYILFPTAWWDVYRADSPHESRSNTKSTSTSFAQFLTSSDTGEKHKPWALELNALSSSTTFGSHAQPTLLFSLYGPWATEVTSLITSLSPQDPEYHRKIIEFFQPYYQHLPNYNSNNPDCTPNEVLATDWHNDDLAGNGSYTNFQVSKAAGDGRERILLDEGVLAMRRGMPERGIWLAGEHTAPFVALGTSTGAYWSGECAATRLLSANGILAGDIVASSGRQS